MESERVHQDFKSKGNQIIFRHWVGIVISIIYRRPILLWNLGGDPSIEHNQWLKTTLSGTQCEL